MIASPAGDARPAVIVPAVKRRRRISFSTVNASNGLTRPSPSTSVNRWGGGEAADGPPFDSPSDVERRMKFKTLNASSGLTSPSPSTSAGVRMFVGARFSPRDVPSGPTTL